MEGFYGAPTLLLVTTHTTEAKGSIELPPGSQKQPPPPPLGRRPSGRYGVTSTAGLVSFRLARGRSSAGRALDWQSRGSRVRVPSPPLEITTFSLFKAVFHWYLPTKANADVRTPCRRSINPAGDPKQVRVRKQRGHPTLSLLAKVACARNGTSGIVPAGAASRGSCRGC